ncbi:Regulating synaptic membrane exocytosis protein 2 [Nymphon striatum]|nr:Regulating synaptic membrane exocytosis protein 2 [Nymphon striatum]
METLRAHNFISKSQSSFLSLSKDNLKDGEAIVLLDFAENYSFVVQDAVQGYYWDNSQATIHPFTVYHKVEGSLKCTSLCVISDHMRHDTATVHAFLCEVVPFLKSVVINIQLIMYWSDGAASQYKNYKNLQNLLKHKEDFGITAEWHFFATAHGKSPCDGIGGTVKRLARAASLQATVSRHILTPLQLYEWAKAHISGIHFFYIISHVVEDNFQHVLESRFRSLKTVPGTRTHHCFRVTNSNELCMYRISSDTLGITTKSKEKSSNFKAGMYVAAMYDADWYAGGTRGANKGNRRKVESVVRNDSLSSDQSESVRPPPPKPHKHKSRGKQKHREISGSSSDDEVRSTPDYTSCDEPEIESESVSEKGETEVLSQKWGEDEIFDAKMQKFFSNPCTWKPSSDGTKYTGYLTLKKTIKEGIGTSDPAILGLKVAGGKYLLNGKIGAIIEKVKKGSIADTVGQLKPGDEILQWNKQSLQGRSIKDVSDIIADTKQDAEVELIVSRTNSDQECNRRRSGVILSHRDYQLDPRKPDMYHDGRPSVTITSPGSPGTVRSKPHSIKGSPRVQLKLWYDSQKQTFYVTVICATDIPLKGPSRKTRNLYVKLYLLPDRGEFKYFSAESKRRTKPIANTNEPKWNVKFIYDCVRWSDLKLNSLEVTLWDYNPKCASDFLGEYVIDINSAPLDNQPEWYSLHDETSQLRSRHNMYIDSEIASSITSADRLSPPSTISRLSDSDASEYDEEFMRVDRKLIGGDGASISSIGSSCSPPLVSEDSSEMVIDTHRLSRRDISLSSIHSTRRRPNIVLSKDDYQYHRGVLGQQNNPNVITDSARLRSRSAAQSPIYDSHSGRSRSKSPNRRGLSDSRSLSPPGARPSSPHGGHRQIVENRRTTQSANATPTGTPSPKKRQLPQIPTAYHSKSFNREFNEKAKQVRIRMEIYKGVSSGGSRGSGSITPVGMYSDTEIVTRSEKPHSYHRGSYMMQQDIDRLNSGMMSMSLSGDRDSDDAASECSSVSKMSVNSAFSTQSERPRGARSFSKFSSRMMNYGPVHQRQNYAIRMQRSPSNSSDLPPEKTDGSLSDTAVTSGEMINDGKRDHSSANRMAQYMGLSKKSRSTSQLSASGRKKRLGFRKKDSTRIRVQRSEEICPHDYQYLKQSSSQSSDGEGSVSSESAHYIPSFRSAQEDLLLGSFLEDLGPGQLVGRQNLVTPCRGDIQLSLIDTKGSLDVEVIRARGLSAKPNSKLLPAPYVKVYLVRGKQIVVKAKTQIARRTLDPLYQQILHLVKSYHDCILQVTVWGDYGRLEKKVFMGAAQIKLDTLDLSNIVIGWYKLYNTPSVPDTSCNTKTMMSSKGSFG